MFATPAPARERLRIDDAFRTGLAPAGTVGVDRANKILRGMVVCQAGVMKSPGRGEFDRKGLDLLVQLGNENRVGTVSHFMHDDDACDGLGRLLGRVRSFRLSSTVDRFGKTVECVRGDLHIARVAMEPSPLSGGKPFGKYILDLAEEDPAAMSASIVTRPLREFRRKADGTLEEGPNGIPLPPLWRPQILWAVDVVNVGDAVDAILRPEPSARDRFHLARYRYRQMERERQEFESRTLITGR